MLLECELFATLMSFYCDPRRPSREFDVLWLGTKIFWLATIYFFTLGVITLHKIIYISC